MKNLLASCGAIAAIVFYTAAIVSAQSVAGKGKTGPAPDPVNLDITGLFQAKYASVGDDLFIGGQPTERALRELKAKGVTTVINLRMPDEMTRIGFDEAALLEELGINYVHIPSGGAGGSGYNPTQLDAFTAAIQSASGKVLLHCTVAWRASHMWAAYLIRERHVPVADALAQAQMINLRMEAPFNGQQPVEGFLGRSLSELRPKQ